MRAHWILLLPLTACVGRGIDLDQGPDCRTINEATACRETAGCFSLQCDFCAGPQFAGCFAANEASICPDMNCPSCNELDETACGQSAGCSAQRCMGCDGLYFESCYDGRSPTPACPDVSCPEICSNLGEVACHDAPDCHGVYDGSQEPLCDCAEPGCCTVFTHCADGPANCSDANLACRATPPFCMGPYVVGYQGQCYEGCVRADACP